jgi:hypothetical protein
VVFANPEVVRRVNAEFIPVALKAAMVNNPPSGIEGDLYAEIGRSKPASQGICTINFDGKVLSWTLSFDDHKSILKFLDHVRDRYEEQPDARESVTAERFMNFSSRPLSDVPDNKRRITIPENHSGRSGCLAAPRIARWFGHRPGPRQRRQTTDRCRPAGTLHGGDTADSRHDSAATDFRRCNALTKSSSRFLVSLCWRSSIRRFWDSSMSIRPEKF